jgi:hypothetical protein
MARMGIVESELSEVLFLMSSHDSFPRELGFLEIEEHFLVFHRGDFFTTDDAD